MVYPELVAGDRRITGIVPGQSNGLVAASGADARGRGRGSGRLRRRRGGRLRFRGCRRRRRSGGFRLRRGRGRRFWLWSWCSSRFRCRRGCGCRVGLRGRCWGRLRSGVRPGLRGIAPAAPAVVVAGPDADDVALAVVSVKGKGVGGDVGVAGHRGVPTAAAVGGVGNVVLGGAADRRPVGGDGAVSPGQVD